MSKERSFFAKIWEYKPSQIYSAICKRSAAIDEFSRTTPEAIKIIGFTNRIHFRTHTPVLPQDLIIHKALKSILHEHPLANPPVPAGNLS
jgi:hypothetical protein